MHINNALLLHGHSSFSLTILEIISISNLTKEDARKLILSREQDYLDSFSPEYNILPTAGSRLGSSHTLEVIAKMSGENNHFFGKVHSEITLEKLSEIKKGQNNPMFGKNVTEIVEKNHEANSGQNHPMLHGKQHRVDTIVKMSIAKGGSIIYVYDTQSILVNSFSSARKAAEYFNVNKGTILSYSKNGKLFGNKWILCTTPISIIVGS